MRNSGNDEDARVITCIDDLYPREKTSGTLTADDLVARVKCDIRLHHPYVDYVSWQMDDVLRALSLVGERITGRPYVIDGDNRSALTAMAQWLMGVGEASQRGIYLSGPTGSGKTLAMTILRKLYPINPIKADSAGPAVRWTEKRADALVDEFARGGDLMGYKSDTPLLCIGDLGAEPLDAIYMGNRCNVIGSILEARGDRDCVTMATSNVPLSRLGELYGDRVASRARQMFVEVQMLGEDRRK